MLEALLFYCQGERALPCQRAGDGVSPPTEAPPRPAGVGGVSNELFLSVVVQLSRRRCTLGFETCAEPRVSLLLAHEYSKLEVIWHGKVVGDTSMVKNDRSPHAPGSLRVSSKGAGTKIHLRAQIEGPVDNE